MTFVQNQEVTMHENVGYINKVMQTTVQRASAAMYWGHLVWICSGLVSYLTLFLTLVNFYCASWWPINCGYSASFWTVVHQKWALKEALSLQKYKDAHTHIHWGWWTNRRQRRNKQKQKKLASLLKSRDEIRYWREELNNWKDQSQHLMVPGYQFRWDGPWYEKKHYL